MKLELLPAVISCLCLCYTAGIGWVAMSGGVLHCCTQQYLQAHISWWCGSCRWEPGVWPWSIRSGNTRCRDGWEETTQGSLPWRTSRGNKVGESLVCVEIVLHKVYSLVYWYLYWYLKCSDHAIVKVVMFFCSPPPVWCPWLVCLCTLTATSFCCSMVRGEGMCVGCFENDGFE